MIISTFITRVRIARIYELTTGRSEEIAFDSSSPRGLIGWTRYAKEAPDWDAWVRHHARLSLLEVLEDTLPWYFARARQERAQGRTVL